MKVVPSRKANLDLMAQIDWLEPLLPRAAWAAERAIRDQFKALEAFPAAGRAIGVEDRKWPIPFGRDGFVAICRIEIDRVVMGRIFHCRQDR